ncbi:MAG: hypothetical protein HY351_04925, partial [Candidatus Omnitrophica bacterium]|nr:hypothetical protein [Candidatus Omnitrophota bacterium]
MRFEFTRRNLKGREAFLERLFEILPGLASWTILLGISVVAFWNPILAAVLIIAFDFYWLLRLFYMTLFLVLAYLRLSAEKETDWMARVWEIDELGNQSSLSATQRSSAALQAKMADNDDLSFKRLVSRWLHRRKLQFLKQSGALPPSSSEIYHLVIFSVAKESQEIIEPGIASLTHQKFPPKQILVAVALEERASESVKEGIRRMQA